MKPAQHCLYNSKVDILSTCGAIICSYFGIAFLLFCMKIVENAVYKCYQSNTLLSMNGLTFNMMNIQNN